ncbi:MAG: amidophosphoribosyltransferase [Alphaproteobacteria bacterium CG11_big_fil_rev_8_21_14_0_20_44_7]|nr:MAG: amidophosphoribosyltransferase [Alphaproteobacteria bacterium CG11_big_fil_rev_8_21_14_0_20_44_7]
MASLYQEPLVQLIKKLKFHENLGISPILGALLSQRISNAQQFDQLSLPQALVAVPLHKNRLHQRGYNQAELIARYLSKQLQIPLLKNAVIRVLNTHDQATFNLQQRMKNMKGAFKVLKDIPKHIAIVDDVITSGSTCHELSRMLKKSGAEIVDVYAVAKTPLNK